MKKQNVSPQRIQKAKKRNVPFEKLRTADVVKVISDSPRRLKELWILLEDRDRRMRDRAAATIARLVLLHPSRFLRYIPRLEEMLLDESAYVRWHAVYTFGFLISRFPSRLKGDVFNLIGSIEDPNRIVRIFTLKALAQVALRNSQIVEEAYKGIGKEMPSAVSKILNGFLKK